MLSSVLIAGCSFLSGALPSASMSAPEALRGVNHTFGLGADDGFHDDKDRGVQPQARPPTAPERAPPNDAVGVPRIAGSETLSQVSLG